MDHFYFVYECLGVGVPYGYSLELIVNFISTNTRMLLDKVVNKTTELAKANKSKRRTEKSNSQSIRKKKGENFDLELVYW